MRKLTIEISDATYEQMAKQAELMNKTPVILVTDLLLAAYGNGVIHSANGQSSETAYMNGKSQYVPKTLREILEEEGMVEPLSDELAALAMPEVTIETVRDILSRAEELSSSELLDEQRGPKI